MARRQKSETFRKWHSLPASRGKHRRAGTPEECGLEIQTLGQSVAADLDLLTPTMRVVVIEDLCWAMAREAWLARRPGWWRFPARRAWAAEEAALDAKRDRLRDMATAR